MKNYAYICENENLKENIKQLEETGYKYIVKAKDRFLTGWGRGAKGGHVQLIAARTTRQRDLIIEDLEKDKSMLFIDWQRIENYNAIYNYTKRGKTFTVRNDWTRAFNGNEQQIAEYKGVK